MKMSVGRPVGNAQRKKRRGPVKTDITPSDFELLFLHLLSKPESVLQHFAAAQIGCLSQIEGWEAMKLSDPFGHARIVFVAATLGIPEHLP